MTAPRLGAARSAARGHSPPGGQALDDLQRKYGEGGPSWRRRCRPSRSARTASDSACSTAPRKQIADAPVALYVAPVDGGPTRGPFYAVRVADGRAAVPSQSVSERPRRRPVDLRRRPRFKKPGRYQVMGVVKLDDRLVAATPAGPPLEVLRTTRSRPWAIRRRGSTPRRVDVGGDVEQIDTRVPPRTMHDENFADVLGKKPVLLLFATPALCQSRVCGPVVDIAEQVKAEYDDDAAFIHMEIYNENEVEKGFRPQVAAMVGCRPSPGCSRSTPRAGSPPRSRARSARASSRRP